MTDDIPAMARFAAGMRGALPVLTGAALLVSAALFFGDPSHAAPNPNAALARLGDGPSPRPKPGKKRKFKRPLSRVKQEAPDCTNSNSNAADPPAAEANAVGVAECDDYIAKYEACIMSKVPENMRATFKSAFDSSRKAWRDTAATPEGRAGLARACKAAHEQAKMTLGSFGCCW